MLNHPGEDLVLQSDFLLMVERVDVCLEFLQSHVWILFIYFLDFFIYSHVRVAAIPGGGDIHSPFPAMPYQGDDTDQNLLCQFTTHPNYRRSESLDRKGARPAYILSSGFLTAGFRTSLLPP